MQRVVDLALGPPPGEATHWTGRMLAKAAGVSLRSVQRILEAHQLAPHRIRTFKLSNDPEFAEKLRDIVGLYVDPPAHAVVLSVDEKSQIQALDRTQPGLPMKKGRAGTMTHDYKRHGTTTLFAALNVLDGTVIGRNMQRHRHQEFIRFLNTVEAQVPARKAIHAIVDNYATHKHPKVQRWLARHPRWTFHFTPTSASWLNAVEGFFAKLTRRRLKRGVFRSVAELQAAINRFVEETNADPKPFVWTADPKRVLAAVKRGKAAAAAFDFPFVEAVGRKQTAPPLHRVAKRRLVVDQLAACIDQQREALGILDPCRDQAPPHQSKLSLAFHQPHDRHRLCRRHVVAGREVGAFGITKQRPDRLRSGRDAVASTHAVLARP